MLSQHKQEQSLTLCALSTQAIIITGLMCTLNTVSDYNYSQNAYNYDVKVVKCNLLWVQMFPASPSAFAMYLLKFPTSMFMGPGNNNNSSQNHITNHNSPIHTTSSTMNIVSQQKQLQTALCRQVTFCSTSVTMAVDTNQWRIHINP